MSMILNVVVETFKPDRQVVKKFQQLIPDDKTITEVSRLVDKRVLMWMNDQWKTMPVTEYRWEFIEYGQGHYLRNERYARFEQERKVMCSLIEEAELDKDYKSAERISRDLIELEMSFYCLT